MSAATFTPSRAWILTCVVACSSSSTPVTPALAPGDVHYPPIIDSHVHLAYWDVHGELAASGVLGVVDLAAPEDRIPDKSGLHVVFSGPMLTTVGGYPLESWGPDGYGIGCLREPCIRESIERLAERGAKIVKLALDPPGLDPALVPIAVEVAHAHGMKVAAHAMTNQTASLAAQSGVDILAHTPVETLTAATIASWSGRAVISTLAAFGGTPEAVANLRALREAGATILYGTDLGNLRTAGPSADEIALLARAGLDNAAIVDAMTTVPAKFWGMSFATSYVTYAGDPRTDPSKILFAPKTVVLDGTRVK